MSIIKINPEEIGKHAKEVDGQVKPLIKEAGNKIGGDGTFNLEGGDFSITCTMAAVAYPGGVQFAFEDLKTHLGMVEDFVEKLNTSSKNWSSAEQASTSK